MESCPRRHQARSAGGISGTAGISTARAVPGRVLPLGTRRHGHATTPPQHAPAIPCAKRRFLAVPCGRWGTALATQVAGPLDQQGRWLLVEVVSRVQGKSALWGVLREEVELSLAERGVEDAEFWQWKERLQKAHSVYFTPLFLLAGEPEL